MNSRRFMSDMGFSPTARRRETGEPGGDAEEIPTVDVNGAGQPGNRIGHRMDDVVAQRVSIFRYRGCSATGLSDGCLVRASPFASVIGSGRTSRKR
jgi:hypothetical protein